MNEFTQEGLPLHKRGTVEIFDVSAKLYKKYFLPVLVWSLVVGLASALSVVIPGGSLLLFFLAPLLIGTVSCCLAGALHNKNITIKDCWEFSSKRYWQIFVVYLLGIIIASLIFFAVVLALFAFFGAGALGMRSALESSPTLTIVAIVVVIALVIVAGFYLTCVFAWMNTAPLAMCLEGDGKDSLRFLQRTYTLMKGQWWRIFSLVSLVGLAALALIVILIGLGSILVKVNLLQGFATGHLSEAQLVALLTAYSMLMSLISILWTPLFYFALGVQYLDLRVRKEALDLEWAASQSSPPPNA